MPVSLAWLLGREELRLRSVVGPTDDVEIGWAHAIELEDPAPWLTGGELVLTTGLWMPHDQEGQRIYVERLASHRVAALAFGTGVHFDEIPAPVVQACADTGLPLVEVPLPTPFIAITQAVGAAVADAQLRTMQRTLDHQKQATRAAVRRGPDGVVATLGRELGVDVLVIDEYGGRIAATTDDPDLLAAVAQGQQRLLTRRRAGSAIADTPDGMLELQILAGRSSGRGCLALRTPAPLGATDRVLVNQAAALLTLLLDRPGELVEAHRELGATLLDLILDGGATGEQTLAQLRRFGFAADDPVVLVRVEPARRVAHLADEVSAALAGVPHLVADRGAGAVVLLRAADAPAATATVVDSSRRAASVLGVSNAVPQARIATALAAADQAAAAARRDAEPVGWFDRLTLRSVLADEAVRDRLGAFAGPALAPLLDGDSSRDRELVASLEAFLHHNGSWEAAARALGVHRHTLRNHVTRIEELTGLDLDVAENRVVLMLALMTRPGLTGSSSPGPAPGR